jgi:glycosyltransferase involved in cell wall biosynthesis
MKLTVLIPVYNTGAAHLIEAVNSIINQDDKWAHRIILVDDGSENPHTLRAEDFLCMFPCVEVHRLEKNQGTSVALNEGHKLVNTEFVAIMGSDDISHHSRFRKQIQYLKDHPEVDVVGTNLFSFNNSDLRRSSIFTSKHPEVPETEGNWVVNHGTVIYRNSAVLAAGGYNPNYRRAQDVELWGRMLKKGFCFRNITEVLYAWRKNK